MIDSIVIFDGKELKNQYLPKTGGLMVKLTFVEDGWDSFFSFFLQQLFIVDGQWRLKLAHAHDWFPIPFVKIVEQQALD